MSHFLNSEAIFEIIGNYPVVDQFDILYSNLQSGSYTDNYITGSMLIANKSTTGVGFVFSQGNRGLAFSKLGVDNDSYPGQEVSSSNRSYDLQPWRERAGITRNVKIFSNSERYYDSLMPSLSQLAKEYGVDIEYFGPISPRAVLTLGTNSTANPNQGRGFLETYVFEPRFSNVRRLKNLDKGFVPTALGSGTPEGAQPTVSNFYIQSYDRWIANNTILTNAYLARRSSDLGSTSKFDEARGAFPSDVAKVVYGYGDWNPRTYLPVNSFNSESYRFWPVFRSGSTGVGAIGGTSQFAVGPIIRGWRYGIFDANPHYTSCIFRKDRFGQFRDMLEQRASPVSYLDTTSAPTRNFGDFELPATPKEFLNVERFEATIDHPVKVTFVRQQTLTLGTAPNEVEVLVYSEQKNRNLTWSSNLSNYATSSLPFFDLENDSPGRNRGEIPTALITSEEVVTGL